MNANGLYVLFAAYNEEKNLEKPLQDLSQIRKENPRLIKKIIVVNDGSTDGTGRIAEKYADYVVPLNKNMGKARAFWEGLKICWNEKAKVMVILDADLKRVFKSQLVKLVSPLGMLNESSLEIKMVIGERKRELMSSLSGERAFTVSAFKALMLRRDLQDILLRGGKKKGERKKRTGAGLEIFLNNFFEKHAWTAPTDFEVGQTTFERSRAGRTNRDRKRFNKEIGRMMWLFQERKKRLNKLRLLRMQRKK